VQPSHGVIAVRVRAGDAEYGVDAVRTPD